MVLPQPAVREGEVGVSGHLPAAWSPPGARGPGPSTNKEPAQPRGVGTSTAVSWRGRRGGEVLPAEMIPEGPFPCLSLRSGVRAGVPGSRSLRPQLTAEPQKLLSVLGLQGPV